MRQLKHDIYAVGAIDWDRRLFDELIPLPDGTSYNCYLVKGSEKTALIDTVDPAKTMTLVENLFEHGVKKIDYIVSHHGEQDHSGSIPDIITLYPGAKVVTNQKCRGMLIDLLHIDEDRFVTVDDGEKISLGSKTLQFFNIPWVHWPETLCTYIPEDKIIFTCDFMGSHMASSSLFADDEAAVYESAKRYYAEIMMPFRQAVRKNLEKIRPLEFDTIAPSHGPVYNRPKFILDAYADWTSDIVKNEVVLPYVSMHGSTRKMVEYLVNALIARNITVRQFDLAAVDIGKLAMALVDAATIVIGSPTVLTGAHPKAAYAAILANALRPKARFASIIGSFGWGGKMAEQLSSLISNLQVEVLKPAIIKGCPEAEDFADLDRLADEILTKHREIKIA